MLCFPVNLGCLEAVPPGNARSPVRDVRASVWVAGEGPRSRSIGGFQVDRRAFPEQVLLVGARSGDGESGPGLVHGGYGSLHLDDGAGFPGVAQRRHLGAYRQGVEALWVVDGEAAPVLGELVYVADGVRVWYRSPY